MASPDEATVCSDIMGEWEEWMHQTRWRLHTALFENM